MSYSIGGSVEAVDYNTFANASANINWIWSTNGTGSNGYGQTSNIANVAVAGSVTSQQWTRLIDTLNTINIHQQGAVPNVISNTSVEIGDVINVLNGAPSVLQNLITQVNTNRLNAATQGATTTNTASAPSPWRNTLTFTSTIDLGGDNQARYYFNAGGQIGLSFGTNGAGGLADVVINNIASNFGVIWVSSPAGASTVQLSGQAWTGTRQLGGAGAVSFNSSLGFYALTGSNQQITRINATSGSSKYTGSFATMNIRYDGSGRVIVTTTFQQIWSSGTGLNVAAGTTATVTLRPPETTNLPTVAYGPLNISTSVSTT